MQIEKRVDALRDILNPLGIEIIRYNEDDLVYYMNIIEEDSEDYDLLGIISAVGASEYRMELFYSPEELVSNGIITADTHLEIQRQRLEWNLNKPKAKEKSVRIYYKHLELETTPLSKLEETIEKVKEDIYWEEV